MAKFRLKLVLQPPLQVTLKHTMYSYSGEAATGITMARLNQSFYFCSVQTSTCRSREFETKSECLPAYPPPPTRAMTLSPFFSPALASAWEDTSATTPETERRGGRRELELVSLAQSQDRAR